MIKIIIATTIIIIIIASFTLKRLWEGFLPAITTVWNQDYDYPDNAWNYICCGCAIDYDDADCLPVPEVDEEVRNAGDAQQEVFVAVVALISQDFKHFEL